MCAKLILYKELWLHRLSKRPSCPFQVDYWLWACVFPVCVWAISLFLGCLTLAVSAPLIRRGRRTSCPPFLFPLSFWFMVWGLRKAWEKNLPPIIKTTDMSIWNNWLFLKTHTMQTEKQKGLRWRKKEPRNPKQIWSPLFTIAVWWCFKCAHYSCTAKPSGE